MNSLVWNSLVLFLHRKENNLQGGGLNFMTGCSCGVFGRRLTPLPLPVAPLFGKSILNLLVCTFYGMEIFSLYCIKISSHSTCSCTFFHLTSSFVLFIISSEVAPMLSWVLCTSIPPKTRSLLFLISNVLAPLTDSIRVEPKLKHRIIIRICNVFVL